MEAWQKGGQQHLFPVDPRGKSREELPYMMRGGSWDKSDLKDKQQRKAWNDADKAYANGGEKRNQSVGFWFGGNDGSSEVLPWGA
ncbi:unnamed protein product [Chrysoparadoxa australica]